MNATAIAVCGTWERQWIGTLLSVVLAALLSLPMPAHAQSAALQEAWRQTKELYSAARFADAETWARKAVNLARHEFGEQSPTFARSVTDLATVLQGAGRYKEAEPLFIRALAIREQALGATDPRVAPAVHHLALLLLWEGRYAEAEPLFRRSLSLLEKTGADTPDIAQTLNGLGNVLRAEGRYREAEQLQRRALSMQEKGIGRDALDVAETLFGLAAVLREQARYAEAEAASRRCAAIREKALGVSHPAFAASLNDLGTILELEGHYAEAEMVLRRALAIDEKALTPQHPDVASVLNNLAGTYARQGRLADAERTYQRALAIKEAVFGPQHPDVSAVLGNIVHLLAPEGRFAQAEPIARRALAIDERGLGVNHPDTAVSVDNLATVLQGEKRYSEAEPLYRRALAMREKAFGPEHIVVAASLHNLASLLKGEGRLKDAEPLYRRAIAIRIKALGPQSLVTGTLLNDLASLYLSERRWGEAEALYRRSLAIEEDRDSDALPVMRRAARILASYSSGLRESDVAGGTERRAARDMYFNYVLLAARLIAAHHPESPALGQEAFAALQSAKASDTAAAVSRMAARFGARNDALASLVRGRQDAQTRVEALRDAILKMEGLPEGERNPQAVTKLRAESDALFRELQRVDGEVASKFPDYGELANPRPISVSAAQNLLVPGEVLLVAVVGSRSTYISVATRTGGTLRRDEMGADALAGEVKTLRRGLSPGGPTIPKFPAATAYGLYRRLFGGVEDVLRNASHVIFVGDGALESLPLSVLLTEPPNADSISDLATLRRLAWFGRRYAVTVLPSVSALRSLRQSTRPSRAAYPFLGIGDPLLARHPPAGQRSASGFAMAEPAIRGRFRGDIIDVEELRSLPSLPETAGELEAEAQMLRATPNSLLLREKATVTAVTHADLTSRRVITFATHALLAGDAGGDEPGLVLTPPAKPSPDDDGLLRASAIAMLKLDADLVVLSACNTAASDGRPEAEGFSGLAKAFLFSGARSLVVSHWRVDSVATVALMRQLFAVSAQGRVGRAEALRMAMLSVMNDPDHPEFAHPLYWAPFVVVGDGGIPTASGGAQPSTDSSSATPRSR